jgi:pimeloyl-ACP methyl ester carboxylesterase
MKKNVTLSLFVTSMLVLGACQNSAPETGSDTTQVDRDEVSFSLEKMNDFYIGETLNDQSLIHSFIPENTEKSPVIMVPGLGLGASIYESTPDDRNGWAYDFVAAGYPVYTVDTSDLASAGLSEEEAEATLSKWDSESIWSRWGLGSGPGEAYEDGQFPVEQFDQFYSSIPMQIKIASNDSSSEATGKTGSRSESGDEASKSSGGNSQEVENMIQLLKKTGPSILLVHSMGGEIGYEVARQRPDLVKGLVAIEPVGSPIDESEVKYIYEDIPYLGVYGDYLESRNQVSRLEAVQTTSKIIEDNGGTSDVIELTEEGITGNSHLMMMDQNSDVIAGKITDWLDSAIQ